MEATYLGDIELTDETLAHYGVKGMKWKYHKPKIDTTNASDAYKRLASMSDEDYNNLLSRIKLTKSSKGGKSSTAKDKKEKASKGSSEKKESSGKSSSKGSAEKKESTAASTKSEKAVTEKQTKTTDERVVYKQQVDPEYTKWLERQQTKLNESKLDSTQVKERMADAEARKKRRAMGVKKIFARM